MSGINKVILVGHLGKDPEIRTHTTGMVANFSIATTEKYRDKDGNKQEHTEWHSIVAWRGLAEIAAKYLHKGSQVYIEGKIRSRSYDKKDGTKGLAFDIIVDTLTMLGAPTRQEPASVSSQAETQAYGQPARAAVASTPAYTSTNEQDDLPF